MRLKKEREREIERRELKSVILQREIESVPRPRPASPLRVWVETRSSGAPSWKFHDASSIQQLADSLDGRGARERALKDALADHLPVFGLDDCDD